MKWLCPAFLLTVFVLWVLQEILGYNLATGAAGEYSAYVTDLVGAKPSQPAQLAVGLVAVIFIFFGLMTARSRAFARGEKGLTKHE
jgi:hypothetical protein